MVRSSATSPRCLPWVITAKKTCYPGAGSRSWFLRAAAVDISLQCSSNVWLTGLYEFLCVLMLLITVCKHFSLAALSRTWLYFTLFLQNQSYIYSAPRQKYWSTLHTLHSCVSLYRRTALLCRVGLIAGPPISLKSLFPPDYAELFGFSPVCAPFHPSAKLFLGSALPSQLYKNIASLSHQILFLFPPFLSCNVRGKSWHLIWSMLH